jgi:CRP-like cAMP-binding protein
MRTSSEILSLLSLPQNRQHLDRFSRRSFEEKNIVSDKETRRGGVFIVTSGRLRVYLSYEGREFTLLFLEPGDVFSMHSDATVEAWQHSEILITDINGFKDILLHLPSLSVSAISVLGKVLMTTTHIIEDLMFRDVKSRLLRFLIELTEEKGRSGPGGIEVPLELNTEDVAMLIGSTRQSTSSILNELIKNGHLRRINRRTMLVKDLPNLKRMRDEPPRRRPIE